MQCDIIYAAPDALFGLPEIKIGTIPGAGGTQYLASLLGKHKVCPAPALLPAVVADVPAPQAMEFILTGASATAQEFERLGLVNRTFPADSVLGEALQLAARIASMSGAVAKLAKRSVLNGMNLRLCDKPVLDIDATASFRKPSICRVG